MTACEGRVLEIECNQTADVAVQQEVIQIHYTWNNLSKNLV